MADARTIIRAGADKISVNSAAVNRPELLRELSEEFGSQAVVLAIDARTDGRGWKVYTRGGRQAEQLDVVQWAQYGSSWVPEKFCLPVWMQTG